MASIGPTVSTHNVWCAIDACDQAQQKCYTFVYMSKAVTFPTFIMQRKPYIYTPV